MHAPIFCPNLCIVEVAILVESVDLVVVVLYNDPTLEVEEPKYGVDSFLLEDHKVEDFFAPETINIKKNVYTYKYLYTSKNLFDWLVNS